MEFYNDMESLDYGVLIFWKKKGHSMVAKYGQSELNGFCEALGCLASVWLVTEMRLDGCLVKKAICFVLDGFGFQKDSVVQMGFARDSGY